MTTSAHLAGSVHELLDLALGEIAASNCEVFSAWYAAIGYLICHTGKPPYKYDCKEYSLFLHSVHSCEPSELFALDISARAFVARSRFHFLHHTSQVLVLFNVILADSGAGHAVDRFDRQQASPC